MRQYANIIGTGSYLPEEILDNAKLAEIVDTDDRWITQRVGIKRRHMIGRSDETTATMALAAAKNALAMAQVPASAIDMIVVGTATPQHYFPSTACLLQRDLGIQNDIPAMDLNAACSGFIYTLSVVDQYIQNGVIKTALIVGVDALTKLVDWKDRSTCVLFGDGAGAVLLTAKSRPGVLGTRLHANGGCADLIKAQDTLWGEQLNPHIQMKGNEVFKVAVRKLDEIVVQILQQCGLNKSDIDWLIPHQANLRIIQATAKRLELPMDKVVMTIAEHGNTSAASIPLALDTAVREGKITRGQNLLLEAFGAGFAWGAALVTY